MGVTIAPGLFFTIALRIASNKVVRLLLAPGSSAGLISSIDTRGSLMRAFISETNSSALTPGNRRQSMVASAVEGITFTFAGDPTPELNVVSEAVLTWMASVYLLRASGPPMLRTISATTGCGLAGGSAIALSSARISVTLALSGIGC